MLSLRFKIFLYFLIKNKKEYTIPRSTRQRVYIFLAADYGNLGDVAITYAQTLFLKQHYPDAEVIEIPISKTLPGIKAVKSIIESDDIITIVGGGNMGDMYDDIEFLRELVVLNFRHNSIISFPQTIDFSQTDLGKRHLRFAKFVYSCHKQLVLMARERVSYDRMKECFPRNDVRLLPDIVMTLDKRKFGTQRNGVVLCLRNDSEKSVDFDLKSYLENEGSEVKEYDTHIGRGGLSIQQREDELEKIWTAFSRAELVVTDRLHGMIFAYITGTPAVVFPNSNFKVEACYEWIKACGYIDFQESLDVNRILAVLSTNYICNFENVHSNILKQYDENFPKS